LDLKPENLFICPGLENFESLAGSREGSNFNPVLERDRTLLREYTEPFLGSIQGGIKPFSGSILGA